MLTQPSALLFSPAFCALQQVVPYGESPRLSCPLQLLADANAWLDYADLDASLVGPCVPGCRPAMRADRFVFGLSRMRQSTTYNR
jgi:hypothetical protein